MLIGFIPLAILFYLSVQLYTEKDQKVNLLSSYIDGMHQSRDITMMIDNLQKERKYSCEYALKKDLQTEMLKQRPKTDSIIQRLSAYKRTLGDFKSYTFLENLKNVRTAIDSGHMAFNIVMDYYTNMIFRFNTLNTLPTESNIYLDPAYKDLVSQKLLSEMVTYLGIMSANIYNALYTRQYMIEILVGTGGVYRVYNTYKTEFLQKASPEGANAFKKLQEKAALKKTDTYLDKLFSKYAYDSTYNHIEWGNISFAAIEDLRHLQQTLLKNAESKVNNIYNKEKRSKEQTLIFLVLTLAFVIGIVAYTIHIITRMLTELKLAAQKISKGETGLRIKTNSNDAIGSLADSISKIDENNKKLAEAATAIGKGNFTVTVQPRSENDLLGNALVVMKNNLEYYINEITNAKEEIAGLNKNLEKKVRERTAQLEMVNKELEAFSYSVSHDLRAPLRAIGGYAQILQEDYGKKFDPEAGRLTTTIVSKAKMMGQLIDDLIMFSKMGRKEIAIDSKVKMQELAESTMAELLQQENVSSHHVQINALADCMGEPNLIKQVWVNLISNAIKYSSTEEKPVIEIGYLENPSEHIYYIKDNGVGFDMKYAHKLFGVFERLHSQEKFQGTGIGLALAKRIIEKHNGRIWAEAAINKGATFYFSIPKKK